MDEGREDQGVERGGKRALDTRSRKEHIPYMVNILTLLVNTSMLHFVHMLKALLKHVLKLDIES